MTNPPNRRTRGETVGESPRAAPRAQLALPGAGDVPRPRCVRCGRSVAIEAYGALCRDCRTGSAELGPLLERAAAGPMLRRGSPDAAVALRRELAEIALELDPSTAIALLETFDLGAPRDGTHLTAADRDDRAEAWWACCQAADAVDHAEVTRLRRALEAQLDGWPGEVVAWFVRQLDGYAEAQHGPLPSAQLALSVAGRTEDVTPPG